MLRIEIQGILWEYPSTNGTGAWGGGGLNEINISHTW